MEREREKKERKKEKEGELTLIRLTLISNIMLQMNCTVSDRAQLFIDMQAEDTPLVLDLISLNQCQSRLSM